MTSRCAWYVGIPGSGKTTAAVRDVLKDVEESGRPLLIIDAEGVCCPGYGTQAPQEAVTNMYERGVVGRVVPKGEEEVGWLCRALIGGRRAIVLIDEASYYTRGGSIVPDLARLLRLRRHCDVSIYATTQYVGDLAPVALQCASEIYAFRTTGARALERLHDEYGLDPTKLRGLKVGEFVHWSAWGEPAT